MVASKQSVKLDDVKMTPFLKRVTLFSSGGPFLDGYVLAIISVALTQLDPLLELDATWNAIIGVAALVGIFVGAIIGGWIADIIGRKIMFTIDIIAIAVISILTMFVGTPVMLVVMRFLIGIVIGADYPIATSLVSEFTPMRYRAISMGVLAGMWYVGAMAADAVGYLFVGIDGGWKWMLGSAVVPGIIILLGRFNIPESPRWLLSKGRAQEAHDIVHKLFGQQVEIEYEEPVKTKYRKIFQKGYFGKVFFVGTIWLCQIIPMFAIYTFGPQIMEAFGLGAGNTAILGDIIISLFFIVGCVPAMFLLNKLGRRPLMIGSFALMAVALGILTIMPAAGIVEIVVLFGLYAFFSGGPGIMQWLYPNELFPTDVRASAVGAAMAFSRIGSIVTTYAIPLVLEAFGGSAVMLIGAVVSLLGFVVSLVMAPETKGHSLMETSAREFKGK